MANQTPYLGSKISLISKLDIRYEGTLYSVNTADSTIALVKVRSLGTEDRNVANAVPARDDVYEHIIFKAADIKDLIVCETPKQPTLGGLPYDPAIVSVSNRPEATGHSAGSSRPITPAARVSPVAQAARGRFTGPPRGEYSGNTYRGYGQPPQPLMRGRGGFIRNHNQHPREKLRFDNDYDFEKANEQYQETLSDLLKDKLSLQEEKKDEAPEKSEKDEEAFYDQKSSFFDNISCEALEKAEGRKGRLDWRKERETNQETFGHQAVRSLNYRRGYGRGYHRRPYGRGGASTHNNA